MDVRQINCKQVSVYAFSLSLPPYSKLNSSSNAVIQAGRQRTNYMVSLCPWGWNGIITKNMINFSKVYKHFGHLLSNLL